MNLSYILSMSDGENGKPGGRSRFSKRTRLTVVILSDNAKDAPISGLPVRKLPPLKYDSQSLSLFIAADTQSTSREVYSWKPGVCAL
jgi:hypothetical protein